jgi:hypothetical protein
VIRILHLNNIPKKKKILGRKWRKNGIPCYNLPWRMRGEFIHYNKLRCFCINDKEGHAWLLKKPFYGFKQSPNYNIKSLIPLWLAMIGVKESMINVFISIN